MGTIIDYIHYFTDLYIHYILWRVIVIPNVYINTNSSESNVAWPNVDIAVTTLVRRWANQSCCLGYSSLTAMYVDSTLTQRRNYSVVPTLAQRCPNLQCCVSHLIYIVTVI